MFPSCRLNWQLHFGEPPKWATDVKYVLVDPEPSSRDAQKAAVVLRGDAGTVASQLRDALGGGGSTDPNWTARLAAKVRRVPYFPLDA